MSMKSVFLTFIIGMAAYPQWASAQIDFAHMPVGCEWDLEYSDKSKVTSRFIGSSGSSFTVSSFETGNPENQYVTSHYSSVGRLKKRIYPDGKWEKFSPGNCQGVMGECEFVFSDSAGTRIKHFSKVEKRGQSYRMVDFIRGGDVGFIADFSKGAFNLVTKETNSEFSLRIVRFRNCGDVNS